MVEYKKCFYPYRHTGGEKTNGERLKQKKKDGKKSCRDLRSAYRSVPGDTSWRLREEGEGAGNGHALACLWRADRVALK